MNSNSTDQRKSKVAAWGATTAILGAQGAAVRHFGGPAMAGFQTGFGAFLRSGARTAFAMAPLPVKLATGVMLLAGVAAKRLIQGAKSAIELAREEATKRWG